MNESMYLFAIPSALEGVARLLDFADVLSEYNQSTSPEEADRLALSLDWTATGKAIHSATLEFASALREGDGVNEPRQPEAQ